MKKGYSFIHKLAHAFSRVWLVIILIGMIFSVQTNALSFIPEVDFLRHVKDYVNSKKATLTVSEKGVSDQLDRQRHQQPLNKTKTIENEAARIVAACSTITTLPCEQVNVTLPFTLNFDGNEGGLPAKDSTAHTGFTMVVAPTADRLAADGAASSIVKGYEPSRLTLADGKLSILANNGLSHTTNNNQINTLGVGVPASGKLTFETTLINPFNGTKSEQAGVWAGLNDKTYVKLVVSGNKVEMRKEVNDVSSDATDQRILAVAVADLDTKTVRLRMVVDLAHNKLEGWYSVDGINYSNVGATYATAANPSAINITNASLTGQSLYAGIFASKRNNVTGSDVSYTFDNFSIKQQSDFPVVTAPYRINAGGVQRNLGSDVFYADDLYTVIQGETSSTAFTTPLTIEGKELYYERRYGSNLAYAVPIANGRYTVKLHFVENVQTVANKRKFNVNLEGVTLLPNLDIFAAAGKNQVLIKTLETDVTDGVLNIDFAASVEKAIINAIEILPVVVVNTAPVFPNNSYNFSVIENTAVGTTLGTVAATDASNQTISYSITGTGSNKFAINTNGVITLSEALNYATDSTYSLMVQATDNAPEPLSSSVPLTVRVNKLAPAVNHAPVAANAITAKTATIGSAFTFKIPAGTFTDADGDTLNLTASLSDNSALPSWLAFNTTTQTFSGTPAEAAELSIKVNAADHTTSVSTTFTLSVTAPAPAVNHAPVVASVIGNATATIGKAFSFKVPAGTFTDADGDTLNLTASLADNSALPSWLAFNTTTQTFSGTPAEAAELSIKVSAADHATSVSTTFTLSVTAPAPAVNHAPVVASVIGNATATIGKAFSFKVPAGTFTDADGDTLNLTASLSDSSALPQWLAFSAATQTFSGTPATAAGYTIKVNASDSKTSVSTTFGLTVAEASVSGCPPNSTLPCNQLAVTLPYSITFLGTEGGLLDNTGKGTGFTMADPYTGTRVETDGAASSNIIGYEPSKLTVTNGKLNIVTNSGITLLANNNQINSLGVQFNASTSPFILETTIVAPYKGANNEQAGLWYGLNDKTFVRLGIDNNRVSIRKELNDLSAVSSSLTEPNRRMTAIISNLETRTVRLRMLVDPVANTVEAFYSINGTTYINVGEGYPVKTLSIDGMGITGSQVYAGVFATQRNGTTAVTYVFDAFSITPQTVVPVNHAPVAIAIENKSIATDSLFTFVVPANTFTDADNDALTLTATLNDGSALPTWLTFNADTKTFSGTSAVAAVYSIKLTANDSKATVSTTFTLTVKAPAVNTAPVVANVIENKIIRIGSPFTFVVPANTFTDADGDVLTLTATSTDSTSLPAWLSFDASTKTFSGTPAVAAVYPVTLKANDGKISVSTAFTITASAINAPPVVAHLISDKSLLTGSAFTFVVPANTFTDADGDSLTLTATLSDGSALPSWLTYNADTKTLAGTPATVGVYAVKINATDGKASTGAEFTIVVKGPNGSPVVVSAPEAQSVTSGKSFSFNTGSFSDPDAGDVIIYSAALADDSALPAWLQFNASNQTFSGTAPADVTSVSVKITATDRSQATKSAVFTITVEAAPVVTACLPISTLTCSDINITLPFALNFDGQEGGLADKANLSTGFTMVDAYTGTRQDVDGTPSSAVIGYEPSKLTIANGKLSILTNKGIGYTTSSQVNNNQINALGVGVPSNGKLTFETTLVKPYYGTKAEQAGLWVGLNDKTYLKLVVTGNTIELRKELNDVSSALTTSMNPDQRVTAVITGLNNQTVRLRMVVNLITNKVEGFYSVDGVTYINAGATYTNAANPAAISIPDMALAGKSLYAGILATHRNATATATYTFDNFLITRDESAGKTLAFTPNALDFAAVQGQTVTGKTTVLSAAEGSPAVTFTSTSASWLTLPAAGLGTVTFGPDNFSSTMAPGIYEATVTASAEGYQSATLLVNLTITEPNVAQEIKVNFQDAATVPPTGWVKDYGQAFGLRTGANQGANLEYGWRKRSDGSLLDLSVGGTSNLGNGRRRTTPADVLLASFMHMQANTITTTFNGTKTEGYWEVKVPNGSYDVTVSAGDSDPGSTERHTINVEGVNAFSNFVSSGTAGTSTRFRNAKVRVTVTDNYLTINADGGINTKINSALITPVSTTPYLVWSASEQSLVIESNTTETEKTFSLDLNHSTSAVDLPINLTAVYGDGAANWLSFDATHNGNEPNVTFNYTVSKSLAVGTYYATVTAASEGYTSANTLIHVTVLAPGANQPYVISSTPANGTTNVSVDISSIAANNLYVPAVEGFKGGVDNATVTVANVKVLKVVGSSTTEIQGIVQGTGGGDAISFSPSFALEANTKYKFVVSAEVKSHSGAAFLPYEASFTTGNATVPTANPVAAEFAPKQVIPGTVGKKYTSLTFGPDGKLYALRLDGVIERFVVDHETGMLSGVVELKSLTNKYGLRSSVGLTFDPASTADNLIAWISHCSSGLNNAPEFDGNISKLSGPNLENEQLVLTKLPRSKADHLVNSIAFGPDGALYYNQGSQSSMGVYDGTWQREEALLSATVMRLDFSKLAGITLPLDARTTNNQMLINSAPADNMRMADGTYNPYSSVSPLTIYASGVRNAFDLVWHSNGQLYVAANGSAAGGNSPASVIGTRRPDGTFYNGPVVQATNSVKVQNDWLFRINPLKPVGYYGHPNPLRGEYVANRGYLDDPLYPTTQGPDSRYRGAAYNFDLNKSPNGSIEYKSNAFGGALKGRILVCRFSGGSDIIVLEPGSMVNDPAINSADSDDRVYNIVGAQTGSGTQGISGLSGFTNPLDLTEDVQTGNLYVIEYNWNNISGKTAQIVLLKASASTTLAGITAVSPAEIVDNDIAGGAAGKNHTITIANTGNANLTVTGIALDGVDKGQFQLLGAPTPTVSAPVIIARGSAVTFNLAFNPTTTGVKAANLLVTSLNNPVQKVALSGLGTTGVSGTNEPSLQLVLDVHGIPVNVGDDNKNTNIIHSTQYAAPILGEEVSIQAFQRDQDGPVIVEPLSVFGPQDAAGLVLGFGWYSSGLPNAKNQLFTVNNANYQTVDVQIDGTTTFDPADESFGFYSHFPYFDNRHLYSEDALNTFTGAIPHHVRVYPLKNTEGAVIEHAYIIATEEHISGFDYQDIAVIVRNVKPYVPVEARQLALSGQSLEFAHTLGTATTAKTITLSANTGSPVVTITKSENSAWLTLPDAALGTLSFGIDGTGLAAGTYTTTVTFSADNYTSATLPVTLTVTEQVSTAMISVSSSELVFDALKNTTVSKRLIITNTGTTGTLNIRLMNITGTNQGKFTVQTTTLDGEPSGTTLAPGETKTVAVAFTPGNEVSTYNAALELYSNAANTPIVNIGLYAMSLNGYEGTNEPPLQTVVNTLGYKINVGWTTLADGTQATMKGEEVPVQLFEKAGDGPVTISPVARYSPNQELPFGFYTKNNSTPVRSVVGTLSGVFGQHNTLYPNIIAGTDHFDPAANAFGIYVVGLESRMSYTEDPLNAGGPTLHAVRTYPLKNRQGELVPNSYLICFEDASNGDYQDYMFVLSNVIAAGTRKTLSFDVSSLAFTAPLNGTAPAKSVTLTAKNGTPAAITFSKVNTSWLTVPNPALGSLSFGINTNGLTAGSYSTTITAEAAGYTSALITVNLHVADVSANAVKVNFQVATAATPAGYMADAGLPYDDTRGYGWVNPTTKAPADLTAAMRDRASTTADLRLRGLAIMQGTTPGTWELKVAPGFYNVTVGVGDIGFYDSKHRINIEGVTAISNFVPTAQVANQITTTTVQVTDGKLTVDAIGGTNTKINFVIAETATAETDFTAPVASVSLNGTLESAGVYKNQVIATVNASDAGGAGLAQVLYSLNNGPFMAYYSPVLVNSPGVYSLKAKAIDGNNNEVTTSAVSFTVTKPEPSNANMVVENLDKFPSNDRLAFSLIQKPWRRTLDDSTYTPYNRNHDVVKVKISNKGTGALTISSLNLTNTTGWKIALLNNVVYDPATAAPITINPAGSVEVGIQFIARYTTGRVRILNDTLLIASNDDVLPRKGIILSGLWQAAGEGNNEPYAKEIINLFGFKTNVGYLHDDGTNEGSSLILNTDEVMSSFFTRADATKPVSVIQMAAYHGCCAATETFQYYIKGATGNNTLLTHDPLDGQSILPRKNNVTTGALTEGTFSTNSIFGLKMSSSYSDRSRNSEDKIGMRIWKAIDANGNVVPNAYIVGQDYIGNPLVTNYDYQDNVYYVSNIKPETGSPNFSELTAVTSAVDFNSVKIGATFSKTIELKNLGQIYANGTTDPAIIIKSVELTGANLNEFGVGTPASLTLAPQTSTTVNVTFRPNSQGIKNAALLVTYNNGLSPLRIPLYGIADDNCNVISVVKRIKGGSDAAVTVNSKVWESDKAYRLGSVQLDKPVATPIAGTDDDVLYQTYLSAAADLGETRYSVPLANGSYMVRMHFVENFFTTVGSRVFNINMENQNSQYNFDIFREVGYKAAFVKDFQVAISDGKLDVKFNPIVNRVALAAMEIFTSTANQGVIALTQQAVTGAECGATTGSLTLGVTNTSATSFLYKLGANGAYQSSPVFTGLASGDYTFYVKENVAGGCETSKAFTVPVVNNLAFTITAPVMACADLTGTATIGNVTGGTGNYTVTWNTIPVQTGVTASGLLPGVYTATLTDASGCIKTNEVTVTRETGCPAVAVRINAGGTAYTASGNRQFVADNYYGGTAGTSFLTGVDILNTTDDSLYLTERSSAAFTYTVPVQNGSFNVILHFAEIYYGAPGKGTGGTGKRAFNVDIEGVRKLTNYDIYAKAGGAVKAIQETFPITVTDGVMNINFTSGTVNKPKISAIEIVPIVNEAPVLAVIGNKSVTVNQPLTFTAAATDANTGQTKTYSLTDAPAGAVINATTGVFSWTPAAIGAYTFKVVVTDNGSPVQSDEEQITIAVNSVVNYAPELAAIGNKNVVVNQAMTFTATATDANAGQTKIYSLTDAPAGAVINETTGVFAWTPAAIGTYTFKVVVTDNGSPVLTDDETITVTVTNVPAPAAIRINAGGLAYTASGSRRFIADTYFGGTAGTSSLTGVDILKTTDDTLYLTERSSSAFTYTVPVQNATYNVILHFAEIYFGIPGKGTGGAGKRKFNVAIEGVTKLTNYDIYAKAGGAGIAIQETFPVTVTDGVMNINFTSGTANKPKISAIEIVPQTPVVNVAPVLAAVGNKSASVNQALTFTAAATDDNTGQTKTYSLVNAPDGAVINATTGVFTWTPATTGTYTFTVKVTDNGSPVLSDEEEITVTVNNAVAPVTLAPVADAYVRSGAYAAINYGSDVNLFAKASTGVDLSRTSYLKFALDNVSQVTSAKLRIYGYNNENTTGINLSAYGVNDDSWTESGIKWNNAPVALTTVLSAVTVNNVIKYYELDVTAYVKAQLAGDKVVSFQLKNPTTQNRSLTLNSRENASNQPQLVIETSGAVNGRISQEMSEPVVKAEKAEYSKSVLYPNPAHKKFTVEISSRHTGNVSMQLISESGTMHKISLPEPKQAGSKAEIDLSPLSLTTGVYLLRVQSVSASEIIRVLINN